VIGDALRSRTDRTEATEVALAAAALNRMLAFGRPIVSTALRAPPRCKTVAVR
jgi:hypothetical protein